MTQQEFDNYRFSVNTEINWFKDIWDKIVEIDFEERTIIVKRGEIVSFRNIKGIRN